MDEIVTAVLPNLAISKTHTPRAFVVGNDAATSIQMVSALFLQLLQVRARACSALWKADEPNVVLLTPFRPRDNGNKTFTQDKIIEAGTAGSYDGDPWTGPCRCRCQWSCQPSTRRRRSCATATRPPCTGRTSSGTPASRGEMLLHMPRYWHVS